MYVLLVFSITLAQIIIKHAFIAGILVVASRIDRESLAPSGGDVWVNATVLARDLGIPESESTKLRVSIRVRDINDNPPKFSAKKFKVFFLDPTN